MESADTKRLQLALSPSDHSYYDDHFQPQNDRSLAVDGLPEDLNAKSSQSAWADFELTDKLFGEFDRLLDEFEIELA